MGKETGCDEEKQTRVVILSILPKNTNQLDPVRPSAVMCSGDPYGYHGFVGKKWVAKMDTFGI